MESGEVIIARDDVVHIRHRSRPGRRLGVAPLQAAAENLAAAASYERIANKLATNSGIPTQGILTTDQDIPTTTAQRYKDTWQARGDGDVAVLGAGLKYQSLTLNPRDLALLELREFDGRQIAAAFGVPPFMVNLAAAGDLTYSTTQGMMDYFWRQTLRPMASNIGRALGTMLPGRSTVLFDADEYTRGTHSETIHTLVEASGGPIMDVDEARSVLNLSPRGGDAATALLAQVTGGQ
jgi:HK97 family phage portal protein